MADNNNNGETLKQQLKDKFGGKTIRVTLSDQRVVKGRLECLDNGKNLILGDAYQVEQDSKQYFIGYAMLPGHHIVNVEMEEDEIKIIVPEASNGNETAVVVDQSSQNVLV